MSFLAKILGIDKILREIRGVKEELKEEIHENRDKIPQEVAEELKEVQEVTSKPISRKILKKLEEEGGRMNVTELRNYCGKVDICSENTFYKYLKRLEAKGVVERVQDGQRKFVHTSSKTFLDVPQ